MKVRVPEGITARGRNGWFKLAEVDAVTGSNISWVDFYSKQHGHKLWCDENAKLVPDPAPVNWKATRLLALAGGIPGDHVLGNVLIQSRKNSKPISEVLGEGA